MYEVRAVRVQFFLATIPLRAEPVLGLLRNNENTGSFSADLLVVSMHHECPRPFLQTSTYIQRTVRCMFYSRNLWFCLFAVPRCSWVDISWAIPSSTLYTSHARFPTQFSNIHFVCDFVLHYFENSAQMQYALRLADRVAAVWSFI